MAVHFRRTLRLYRLMHVYDVEFPGRLKGIPMSFDPIHELA